MLDSNSSKKVVDWLVKQPGNYDPSDDKGSDANDEGNFVDESTRDSNPAVMYHSEEECSETERTEKESSEEESSEEGSSDEGSSGDSSPGSTPERKRRRREKKKKKDAAKRRKLYPGEDPEDEYPEYY